MRFSITVINGVTGAQRDVLVDADPDAPLADVLPVLEAATAGATAHPAFARRMSTWIDGREVDPATSLRDVGLVPGVTVALHEPGGSGEGLPRGVVEVRVVSGPGAGRVRRFGIGDYVVGCGAAGLSLPDVKVPADALEIRVTTQARVEVLNCSELVLVDGVTPSSGEPDDEHAWMDQSDEDPADDETLSRRERKRERKRIEQSALTHQRADERDPGPLHAWPADTDLRMGDTLLRWQTVWLPDSDVSPSEDRLGSDFNRPPRLLPPARERSFVLPAEPSKPRRVRIPWPIVLTPLLMAGPMAVIIGPRFLAFALLSPIMGLFNYISQRRGSARDYREAMIQFRKEDRSVRRRIRTGLDMERAERVESFPDAAELLLHAVGPGSRLWSRRRSDPDYLTLRLGVADRPTDISIKDKGLKDTDEPPPPHQLGDVPVGMPLRENPVVGVTGSQEGADAMARWLCGQAATLHAPLDLRLVVLTDEHSEEQWGWVRWLPHARLEGEPIGAFVGTDQESVARRVGEIGQLIGQRREQQQETGRKNELSPPPDILVVLDGARRLRALPGVVTILRDGPACGIYVLCLDEDERSLPEECQAILTVNDSLVEFRRTNTESVARIRPDVVEAAWAERVARALAPLRDTTPSTADSGLPSSARLLDCLGMPDPTPEQVRGRWGPDAVTDVVIGAGYDGDFRLDLRRDGPHALLAGTTGSGKSEFLQTIVASLAVANRPDQLTFVLVDYKGGSAFKDCALLPHTVGMVTDLDTRLVGRALTSLGAELKRREHLLGAPGAKDLEDYWALQRRDPSLPTIPRLAIVIDEFASLKAELPDFVTGLVTIAQRGRSLGIHLVLATQRPSGVISNDIRANTNLRIALRVTDESESRDVIDAPEAAQIGPNQPGRGYARLGHSSLLPFQAGRVGGARPRSAEAANESAAEPLAWPIPWRTVGGPAPARPKQRGTDTDEGETDLSVLVEAIRGAVDRADIPAPHAPWLSELPAEVTLAQLRGRLGDPPELDTDAVVGMSVPWMLVDLPADQAQEVRQFVLGGSGHLQVIGGPRSGRSTALRTIAAGLVEYATPRDLHLYGLDCGNGALLPLAALPHTGAVVQRVEIERASRLLDRLGDEVTRRQAVLGAAGYADIDEQRRAVPVEDRLPYVVLLLDRWEGFVSDLAEVDMGRLSDRVFSLLREGASVGVQVVMSGDRTLLNGRISSMVEHRVVLRLPDRSDFTSVGIRAKDVPENMLDGRGLWGETGIEGQVATLGADATGAAQSDQVRRLAARLTESLPPTSSLPVAQRPFRLDALPTELSAVDVLAEPRSLPAGHVPLAVGGDDLTLLHLEAVSSPVLVVGAPRSGRTNTLTFIVAHADHTQRPTMGFTPVANQLTEALGDRAVVGTDAEPEAVVARLRALPDGALIVVDDAESLREGPLAAVMMAVVKQARDKQFSVVVAGSATDLGSGFSGWLVEARKGRKGMILSPQEALSGDLFGGRIARTSLVKRIQPGRGVLFPGTGDQVPVQVPLV